MATVVHLSDRPRAAATELPTESVGEVIIFPGVRVERYDMDLGARLKDAAGKGSFERFGSPAG